MYFAASKRNADHLAQYESQNPVMNLKDEQHAEQVVRELATAWTEGQSYFFALLEKASGEWAGQIYVAPTDSELPEFTIGYVADVNYEGKGYVSEAVTAVLRVLFQEVGAHRVASDCNENNSRSWRLLERCGFTREGHLRENREGADGALHGDYLYGLLRREFQPGLLAPRV